MTARSLLLSITAILLCSSVPRCAEKPLKVYILAGQSNMEGHAKVETFDYIGDDPQTAPLLQQMRNPDGSPRVCERVWISNLTGSEPAERFGPLTTGYGARRDPAEDGGKIGPEYTFGITMQNAVDGPILLIKTAWGGKSLHTDFRPPSAGPYVFNKSQLEKFEKQVKNIDELKATRLEATGKYYRLMIEHVRRVLADPKRVVPNYDASVGCELAGFVWFQGWNDMVDSGTYPNRREPHGYDNYSKWMADFIRDVRADLDTPNLPFVIGVIGVGGLEKDPDFFRQAMAAPADLPEFHNTVTAVQTASFWEQPLADLSDEIAAVTKSAYYLRKGQPFHIRKDPVGAAILDKHMPADGKITEQQIRAFVKEYRAAKISAEREEMWTRGASNARYHYLGCGKTLALIGQAFAEAMLRLERH
ncbi:MAG: sialate O-acetylesterase [Planctomycetaceae bacterium]